MRAAILPLVLFGLAAGCRTRLPEAEPHEFLLGAGVSAEEAPGLVLKGAQRVSALHPKFDLWIEGQFTRQWGDVDLGQVELGVRHVLSPGHPSHLYFRYGATWLRLVGDSDFIDVSGDYLGVYAGVGYEWDLTSRISCGPEIDLYPVGGEGKTGWDFLPRALFQLNVKF